MRPCGGFACVLRLFEVGAFLFCLLIPSLAMAHDHSYWVYVGTYTGKGSQGIYAFPFDAASGVVGPVALAATTENPSFLAADPRGQFLYAVNEVDAYKGQRAGGVSAFSIDRGSGALELLDAVSSLGRGPAHLSIDRTGRYVMVANYGGGSAAVFRIGSDGGIREQTALVQAHGSSVNHQRQEAPHAHFVQTTPDNRFALVADLGIDKLLVYHFDEHTGGLTLDSLKTRSLEPGAGPRHVAIVPSGRHLYVVNELNSTVTHFAVGGTEGMLEVRESVSTLPPRFKGTNSTAEIIVDSRGKFLYVSNRGDDSIVLFSIHQGDGSLSMIDHIPCGGKSPRHIALDPTGGWLFSANQNSNAVTLFRVNPEDGRLTATSRSVHVSLPVCVTFVARP